MREHVEIAGKRFLVLVLMTFMGAVLATVSSLAAEPTLGVNTSLVVPQNGIPVQVGAPNSFTWGVESYAFGAGWDPGEEVTLHLYGPLNSLGVSPTDHVLDLDGIVDVLIAGSNGEVGGSFLVPNVRPGRYQIYGTGNIQHQASAGEFNLLPEIRDEENNWAKSRGRRKGWLGDQSPELIDPEWVSVWDEKPVGLYGTIAETDLDGGNQPALISHHEIPSSHYAHDANLLIVPDPEYFWVLGTSNFAANAEDHDSGRIELEWEVLNNGNPYSYGEGQIGLPLWADATAGDSVYAVGRWALDNGHPPERTEIHPPRLLATIRKRHTVVPLDSGQMTRARQVDIFVSPHGGGVNAFPDGLSSLLDNNGLGGGRIEDALSPEQQDLYYAWGPADSIEVDALAFIYGAGDGIISVLENAGPSAFGWFPGPEARAINDMDYDFDVWLPAPPPGATGARVQVTTHPEHTTGVEETITYTGVSLSTGVPLPTKAHIHLPYKDADNGIYARTLKFYWDTFNPPGEHYVVTMNQIALTDVSIDTGNPSVRIAGALGKWNMWADICGNWFYLTGLNPPAFTDREWGSTIDGLEAASFDVYLDPTDTVRVFTLGYEPHDFESLYGVDVGLPAYEEGIKLAHRYYFGTGDDVRLGGALYPPGPAVEGRFSALSSPVDYVFRVGVEGFPTIGAPLNLPLFTMDYTVAYVPNPDFYFSPISPINIPLGGSGNSQVEIHSFDAFNSAVTLSAPSPSSGFTSSFSPNPVTPPAGGLTSSAWTVDLQPSVLPGTYELNVAGTSGSLTRSASLRVTVEATPDGISNIIGTLQALGCIDNAGISNAFSAKLAQAQAQIDAGNVQTAVNILTALLHQLQAQAGMHLHSWCTDSNGAQFDPVQVLMDDVSALLTSWGSNLAPNPVMGFVENSGEATVSILNFAKKVVALAETDSTGFYFFANTGIFEIGSEYSVKVNPPKPYKSSTPGAQAFGWQGAEIILGSFVLQ